MFPDIVRISAPFCRMSRDRNSSPPADAKTDRLPVRDEGFWTLWESAVCATRWARTRTRIWLEGVHHMLINAKTLKRVSCDLGLPRHENTQSQAETV
jgi:hypothetical protein